MCSAVPNLIQFSWNLKILYGAAQDAIPLSGKHRIPYIIGGWMLVVGTALVLVFFADNASVVVYSAICAVLELGLAVADTAADALMVQYSAAESPKERGTIMSTCYALRFFSATCSSLAVAVLFNGVDEGGDFSWSLSLG